MAKKIFEETKHVVDTSTGEVLKSEITTVKTLRGTDEFVQVYLEDFTGLFKLETATEIKLLALLWKASEWNAQESDKGNSIVVIKTFKEQWANELGCTLQTVNNTLSSLLKKDLIIKKERMIYYLNPKYFFKGFINDRKKVMRAIIEYRFEIDLEPNQE